MSIYEELSKIFPPSVVALYPPYIAELNRVGRNADHKGFHRKVYDALCIEQGDTGTDEEFEEIWESFEAQKRLDAIRGRSDPPLIDPDIKPLADR